MWWHNVLKGSGKKKTTTRRKKKLTGGELKTWQKILLGLAGPTGWAYMIHDKAKDKRNEENKKNWAVMPPAIPDIPTPSVMPTSYRDLMPYYDPDMPEYNPGARYSKAPTSAVTPTKPTSAVTPSKPTTNTGSRSNLFDIMRERAQHNI